jgi:hypothetical protein
MKRITLALFLSCVCACAQPVPIVPSTYSVTLRATNYALIGVGTNVFWSNMNTIRLSGIVAPTNTPTDGYVPVARGNMYKWEAQTGGTSGGGTVSNATAPLKIVTGSVTLTNVNLLNLSTNLSETVQAATHILTNVTLLGDPEFITEAFFDTDESGVTAGGTWSFTRSIWGDGTTLTLGQFKDQDVGSRYLRNDDKWIIPGSSGDFLSLDGSNIVSGTISAARLGTNAPAATLILQGMSATEAAWMPAPVGSGDMLITNHLAEFSTDYQKGQARTNIGGHQGSNITAGTISPAQLGTNTPATNLILRATSATTAAWMAATAGYGDMLKANNLTDLNSFGISLTNLTSVSDTTNLVARSNFIRQARSNLAVNVADNLTEGVIPAARLADGGSLSNLVNSPYVVEGDGNVSVSSVTNAGQQRIYSLGLSGTFLGNLANYPFYSDTTNVLKIYGLTNSCMTSYEGVIMLRGSDGNYYPQRPAEQPWFTLYAASGSNFLQIYIDDPTAETPGQPDFGARYTNSTLYGTYTKFDEANCTGTPDTVIVAEGLYVTSSNRIDNFNFTGHFGPAASITATSGYFGDLHATNLYATNLNIGTVEIGTANVSAFYLSNTTAPTVTGNRCSLWYSNGTLYATTTNATKAVVSWP